MPTFQVTCATCGEERWPTLAMRPIGYVCVRCTATTAEQRARRRAAAERGRAARQKKPL